MPLYSISARRLTEFVEPERSMAVVSEPTMKCPLAMKPRVAGLESGGHLPRLSRENFLAVSAFPTPADATSRNGNVQSLFTLHLSMTVRHKFAPLISSGKQAAGYWWRGHETLLTCAKLFVSAMLAGAVAQDLDESRVPIGQRHQQT
jgi:hypothetical protein